MQPKFCSFLYRALMLHDMQSSFMPLAGAELLCLSCRCSEDFNGLLDPDIPAIANLRGLTRLELIGYKSRLNFGALRQLGLKELVLVDCPHILEALFVPGALTALQKLQIVERYGVQIPSREDLYQSNLRDPLSEGYLRAHQLHRLGAIILSLPSLVQVSGECRVFLWAIAEELEGWHKSKPSVDYDFPMSSYNKWSSGHVTWVKPSQP